MSILNGVIARRSIRDLLSLTTLCVAIPLVLMVLYLGHEQYQSYRQAVAQRALELVQRFVVKHEDVVLHARTLLETLASQPGLTDSPPDEIHARLLSIAQAHPRYSYLNLVRPDGSLWASSASVDHSIDFSDRVHFRGALRDNRFSVGEAVVSRTTGRAVLPFAAPVNGPDGKVAAVLVLGFPIEQYDLYFESLNLPEGGRMVLFDHNGTRLLRFPRQDLMPEGQKILPDVWEHISRFRSHSGTFELRDQDGRAQTYAFTRFSHAGEGRGYLGVLAAIPPESWASVFWPSSGRALLLMILVSALAMAAVHYLSTRAISPGLEALEGAAGRIAKGERITSVEGLVGPREIISLGAAMVTMSESLKQAEKALRAQSARLRDLLDTSTDGIHVINAKGQLVLCSPSFAHMLGYRPEETVGMNVRDWDVHFPKEELPGMIQKLMEEPRVFETLHRRADGTILSVEISARRVELDGNPLLYNSARDISERKRAERFRQDVERIIRHDIKSPLAGLHTMAACALQDELDQSLRDMAPDILRGVEQVVRLVDSSDKMMDMEKGTYKPRVEACRLWDMLGRIEVSLGPLLAAKKVRIHKTTFTAPDGGHETPIVLGEEFLLEDMLMNLAKNAVEAAPEESEVRVGVNGEKGLTYIMIHNLGEVPEAVKGRFFEKFITHGKKDGTGLGTYSALLIARAHGGDIRFTSSAANGTTVSVTLPA